MESLRKLGVSVEIDEGNPESVTVEGCGGRFPVRSAELFLGNAGTAARPLTAALALAGGSYLLDGVERMRERPIGDPVSYTHLTLPFRFRKSLLPHQRRSVESVHYRTSPFLAGLLRS